MSDDEKGGPKRSLRKADLGVVVIDTTPAYCVATTLDGTVLLANQGVLRALGYSEDEVVGRDYLTTFVPERERARVAKSFTEGWTGDAYVNESWAVAKDGSERLVEWRGTLVRNEKGEPDYFFAVGTDVTERRRTQEALRRSEQRLALHVQQTPLGVVEWDLDFKITDWNPAASRIFGYSREEVIGRHPIGLIIPESLSPYIDDVWQELLRKKGGQRSTNENLTKSGKSIVCDWYNTPLVGEDGSVIGVASLVADVTEQRTIEAELRATQLAQAEMIEQLSAPILDVWQGVLAMPIIGEVDERRAARMTESLLAAIVSARASVTVIDLTGIGRVNAGVATHLLKMVRAAELLGCRSLICGISPEVALATVEAARDLGELATFGTLRDALGYVLRYRAGGPPADQRPA